MRHEVEARRQLESSLEEMRSAREKLEAAWAIKFQGIERANTDAEQALQLHTKRWNQAKEAHERALEAQRTEISQVTTDCRDLQVRARPQVSRVL